MSIACPHTTILLNDMKCISSTKHNIADRSFNKYCLFIQQAVCINIVYYFYLSAMNGHGHVISYTLISEYPLLFTVLVACVCSIFAETKNPDCSFLWFYDSFALVTNSMPLLKIALKCFCCDRKYLSFFMNTTFGRYFIRNSISMIFFSLILHVG